MSDWCEEKQPTKVGTAVGVFWSGVADREDDTAGSARVKRRPALFRPVIVRIQKVS